MVEQFLDMHFLNMSQKLKMELQFRSELIGFLGRYTKHLPNVYNQVDTLFLLRGRGLFNYPYLFSLFSL